MHFTHAKTVAFNVSKYDKKTIDIINSLDNKDKYPFVIGYIDDDYSYVFCPDIDFEPAGFLLQKALLVASVVATLGSGYALSTGAPMWPLSLLCVLSAIAGVFAIVKKDRMASWFIAQDVIKTPMSVRPFSSKQRGIDCEQGIGDRCQKIVEHAGLDEFYHDTSGKSETSKHQDKTLCVNAMIIHAINFGIKYGNWSYADKIMGAISQFFKQEKKYNVDEDLLTTLSDGIGLLYLEMIDRTEEIITTQEKIDAMHPESKSDYWRETLNMD